MKLNQDQNRCCTALCLTELNSPVDVSYRKGIIGKTKFGIPLECLWGGWVYDFDTGYDDVGIDTEESFHEALALLRHNFVEYLKELSTREPGSYPRNFWGTSPVDNMSTVFCFTGTGPASDHQENVERYLESFGFIGTEQRSSKKYKGESLVRLWSVSAEDFCKKSDEVMKRIEEKYGINPKKVKPDGETDAPPEKAKKGKRAKRSSPIIIDDFTSAMEEMARRQG